MILGVNNWVTANMRGRAIGTAIVLAGILLVTTFWGEAELVGTQKVEGELIEILGKTEIKFAKVRLDTGNVVKIFLPDPPPKVGNRLPLIVELYDDKSRMYRVDFDAWLVRSMQ
jgi:hypothetical protein